MQFAEFKGFCPYEIGDKVMTKYAAFARTIRDIRTIHYLKSGKTEFEFQMEDCSEWISEKLICRIP